MQDYFSQFKPSPGRALVVGSRCYNGKMDRRTLYQEAIGLDMQAGDGVDIVHNLENPLDCGTFDHIDICSVLEHVARPWLMCANIESVMNPGASITLSVPFVWRQHGYPSDYWRMTKAAVRVLFPSVKWEGLDYVSEYETVKVAPSKVIRNVRFFKKTEVLGFGYRHSDNPEDVSEG